MHNHVVAIHQPNFFPWLGYFDKIRRADTFILLDDVQFPKTGGAWTNRVKILHQGEACWFTAPIDRSYSGVRSINAMQFSSAEWRVSLRDKLRNAYKDAPYFRISMPLIESLLMYNAPHIAAYNTHTVRTLCDVLGLGKTTFRLSSELAVHTASTERLIALTQAVGGTHYLAGGGAEGYQDDAAFDAAGVTLVYQNFTSTPYPQQPAGDFVAGLSVIDALMHLGIEGTAAFIHDGAANG